MNRKLVLALALTLLVGALNGAFNIQPVKAGGTVGVKAGDWIKCTYTISGWPAGTPYPEWLKVEFLSVEGTNATIRVTMRMSDGTEQNDTMTVDVATGGGTFQGQSGFVIPANCTTGDSIYMTGYGNVTIAGEATGTYAGASRTVVYASFSQYGTQLTYYWDKLTGVLVEASAISGGMTGTARATETNMWQPETSGTIYIRADGSIDPPDAPISTVDNVTYTLTGNINGSIVIERDNIVVDGAGYTIQGTGSGTGMTLSGRSNITIKNTEITTFGVGIWLDSSSDNDISGSNITDNDGGIYLGSSSNNTISGNNIANNHDGIILDSSSNNNTISGNSIAANNNEGIVLDSSNNIVSGNNITANNYAGIDLLGVSNNIISGNDITNNGYGNYFGCGIYLISSNNNTIIRNNIANNSQYVIRLGNSSNNLIYHNNFVNNTVGANPYYTSGANVWDDGYPSGGNYWNDYAGVDSNHDGIGDTSYIIDANNTDNYPLMTPYIIPEFPSFLILPLFMMVTLLAVIAYRRKTRR